MKSRIIATILAIVATLMLAVSASAETIHPDRDTYKGAVLNTKFPAYFGWFLRERSLTDHSLTQGDDLPDNQKPYAPTVTLSCASANSLNIQSEGEDPTDTVVPVDGIVVADANVLDSSALAGFDLVNNQVVTRTVRVEGANPRVRLQIDAFNGSVADTRQAWTTFDMSKCVPPRTSITIDKSGQSRAYQGKVVPYKIIVKNTGKATAINVVVTDRLPAGMVLVTRPKGATFKSGVLTWKVGNILPGASRTVTVKMRFPRTSRTVRRCNTGVASAANASRVTDSACTRFLPVKPEPSEPGVAG